MAFKHLFVNKTEEEIRKEEEQERLSKQNNKTSVTKESNTKFPNQSEKETTETSVFNFGFNKTPAPTPITPSNGKYTQEHLDKAVAIYQNGFDSLNQNGYDFYEYYTVVSDDIENPMAYNMAFKMAKLADKSVTKESLISQSAFYTGEITKSYNEFIAAGNTKKSALLDQKGQENQTLLNDLEVLKQQLETIKVQIQDRESKLNAIDGKYEPMINDIDSKLAANDVAKSRLIDKIEQVKQGITNNIK